MTKLMSSASKLADLPLNRGLTDQVAYRNGPRLGGSLYAVEPADRMRAAEMLGERGIWLHADLFENSEVGVPLAHIRTYVEKDLGRVDAHLLTAGALRYLDELCDLGVTRVTYPVEGVANPFEVARQIRRAGVSPWLALSPETSIESCVDMLSEVDGVLVMLIRPGSQDESDLSLLAKVSKAAAMDVTVGVDGGVNERNLDDIIDAGATYLVVGRRLFTTIR